MFGNFGKSIQPQPTHWDSVFQKIKNLQDDEVTVMHQMTQSSNKINGVQKRLDDQQYILEEMHT